LYPFVKYGIFFPLQANIGWHIGAGLGYMYASYIFAEYGKYTDDFFLADISTGFIFGKGITVSYSLRTNFDTANNKIAIGYSYRFR